MRDQVPVNPRQARLLVVDDDFSFLTFACAVIEQMRVRADVAMSGADALRRLDAESFAGVLLDLRLPDIDGLEVLREVRTGGNEVPVVMLTGAGTIPTAVEAMRLGVETFIEKPIPRHVLMRTVELLVAGERRSLNERTNERTNEPWFSQPTAAVRANSAARASSRQLRAFSFRRSDG